MKQETDASFSHLKISAVVYSLIFTMFSQLFYVQMCMYVCERDLRDKCVKNNIMIDNAHITCEDRWKDKFSEVHFFHLMPYINICRS